MRSWLFYPPKEEVKKFTPEEHLLMLLFNQEPDRPTADEWNENIPESKASLQQPSLGFFCGDSISGTSGIPDMFAGLPAFPVRIFDSVYMVMPKTWQNDLPAIIVESKTSSLDYFVRLNRKNIIVSGMLLHEPCVSIRGGRTFLFSKYLEKGQSAFMKTPLYFHVEQHVFPPFLNQVPIKM